MSLLGPHPAHPAPLGAGHPLALPARPPAPPAEFRVPPVRDRGAADLSHDLHRRGPQAPAEGAHKAPPSILQMKIDSLLREQAEKRAEEEAERRPPRLSVSPAPAEDAAGSGPPVFPGAAATSEGEAERREALPPRTADADADAARNGP